MTTARIIPTYRYDDCLAAIAWLERAFGFEKHAVYMGEDDTVAHAQLVFHGAMIMLGSARDDTFGVHQQPPTRLDGVNTSSAYLIVADPDAIYDRAVAAGATVIVPCRDEDYGGRGFTVKDPEGVLWSFGSYDPFAADG